MGSSRPKVGVSGAGYAVVVEYNGENAFDGSVTDDAALDYEYGCCAESWNWILPVRTHFFSCRTASFSGARGELPLLFSGNGLLTLKSQRGLSSSPCGSRIRGTCPTTFRSPAPLFSCISQRLTITHLPLHDPARRGYAPKPDEPVHEHRRNLRDRPAGRHHWPGTPTISMSLRYR